MKRKNHNITPERAVLTLLNSIAGAENMAKSEAFAKSPHKRMKYIHSLVMSEIKSLNHESIDRTNSESNTLRTLKVKAECLHSLYVLSMAAFNSTSLPS